MRRNLTILWVASAFLAWVVWLLGGWPIARWMGAKWGARIVAMGDGKVTDASFFIHGRIYECALLLTASVLVFGATVWVSRAWARRFSPLWQWIPYAVTGLVGTNVLVKIAVGTVLFWGLFWNGKNQTDSMTQFNLKLLLLKENLTPIKIAMGGNSQMHAQVDSKVVNHELGPTYHCAELGFPGTRGCDYIWLDRELKGSGADTVVCYVSEGYFLGNGLGYGTACFLSVPEIWEYFRLGWRWSWHPMEIGNAVLGNLLPLYRIREPVSHRLLGSSVTTLEQRARDSGLAEDLEKRAAAVSVQQGPGEQPEFQLASFEAFVSRCNSKGRRVVICSGQVNPILQRKIDPELIKMVQDRLRGIAGRYDNVRLLDEKDLPVQTESDYVDLTHVNEAARVRFSKYIAEEIRKMQSVPAKATGN